jgi:hypothetical protein
MSDHMQLENIYRGDVCVLGGIFETDSSLVRRFSCREKLHRLLLNQWRSHLGFGEIRKILNCHNYFLKIG